MSARIPEQLARELGRGLAPVRRVPRLRVAFGRILIAAALWAAAFLAVRGVAWDLLQAPRLVWVSVALVAGLSLVGAGATLAALALAVPGRESAERAGFVAAAIGASIALGIAPALRIGAAEPARSAALAADLACLLCALALGVLPATLSLWFIAHAAPRRIALAVSLACVGAVGLGCIAARAGCAYGDLRHLLLGHALAPLLGGALLAIPLGLFLRAVRRTAEP